MQLAKIINTPHAVLFSRKAIRWFLILFPLCIVCNILFSLYFSDALTSIPFQTLKFRYFLLAFILTLIPWFTNSFRLYIWTRFLRLPIRVRNIFSIILGAEIGSAVSPTAVGGGCVKLGLLMHNGFSAGTATSLMTLGTFEDSLFFLSTIPIFFLMTTGDTTEIFSRYFRPEIGDSLQSGLTVIGGVCLICVLLVFLFRTVFPSQSRAVLHRLIQQLRKISSDYVSVYKQIISRGKIYLAGTLTLTAIQWICRYSVITALIASMNLPVQPVTFFFLQWVVFTIAVFVPTPGGAIGTEAVFYIIFSQFLPNNTLGPVAVSWRFLTFYFLVVLSSLLFAVLQRRRENVYAVKKLS